jgi:hypothetical protein
MEKGTGDFAAGPHTTQRRAERERHRRTPRYVTQYADLAAPEFAPVALRLRSGGALVFFATRHHLRQTVSADRTIQLTPDVKALLTGTAKRSVAMERVSSQAVVVPPADAPGKGIRFLSRIDGLVAAKGG